MIYHRIGAGTAFRVNRAGINGIVYGITWMGPPYRRWNRVPRKQYLRCPSLKQPHTYLITQPGFLGIAGIVLPDDVAAQFREAIVVQGVGAVVDGMV